MSADGNDGTGALTAAEVRRIAELAGLRLTDDEVDRLAGELGELLEHFESAKGAEGSEGGTGVPGPDRAPLRADQPGADRLAEGAGAGAPEWRDGLFLVPSAKDTEDVGGAEGRP